MPEKFWDATASAPKHSEFRADYDRLLAADAAAASKRLTLPANAESYKHDLPKDFKVPEGFGEFKFNTEDPALKNFATVAHEAGLSQEQYSKALSSYASTLISSQQQIKAAMAAEIGKLGVNGTARMDALRGYLTGAFGDAMAETVMGKTVNGQSGLGGMLWTAKQVEFLEAVVARLTSGGAASFSQQHRDVEGARLTDEQYSKLTQHEKREYAAKFDQSKFRAA